MRGQRVHPEDARYMVHGEASTEIARPLDTVYAFVVAEFFSNYPRWSPEVRSLEPLDAQGHPLGYYPPLQVGTRARQIRVDHGRRSETIVQAIDLEPKRHVAFASTGSPKFTSAFDFAAQGAGTALHFRFDLTELKLYMRPFEALIRRAIQDGSERTVGNIRELIEGER